MLAALRISSFAVIEEVEVAFGEGLTVLTGETGAGKSVVVEALGLLLGGRADPEVIRAGAEEAVVEALFTRTEPLAARLREHGLPDLGDEVSVRRVICRKGRGRAYVNGALVTVGVLGALMRGTVDLAGQHESVRLFEPAVQRDLLDGFGGLVPMREAFAEAFAQVGEVDRRIAALGADEAAVAQRLDFLRFQIDELDRVAPSPGEDCALDEERRRLGAVEKLGQAAREALGELEGEDRIRRALRRVQEAARVDSALAPIEALLSSAVAELQEAASAVEGYLAALQADPDRLAQVEERLDQLRRLCRKHARPLEEVIALREALWAERRSLETRGEQLEALAAERQAALAEAESRACQLSKGRQEAATRLAALVREGLGELALESARFEVELFPAPALRADGQDVIELQFGANPGEPLRPLSRVASGGELSRVLLALKRGLAALDGCGCYLLDEADAGVSGAVADAVGRMIHEVSRHKQVICITHLPQVAAYADAHLRIRKHHDQTRTRSEVVPLRQGQARTRELARMISGVRVTPEALGAAEALVRSARRGRRLKVA